MQPAQYDASKTRFISVPTVQIDVSYLHASILEDAGFNYSA